MSSQSVYLISIIFLCALTLTSSSQLVKTNKLSPELLRTELLNTITAKVNNKLKQTQNSSVTTTNTTGPNGTNVTATSTNSTVQNGTNQTTTSTSSNVSSTNGTAINSSTSANTTATAANTTTNRTNISSRNLQKVNVSQLSTPEGDISEADVHFYYAENIVCTRSNCPLPNNCIDDSTCQCYQGFVDYHDNSTNNNTYCNYKQKKQIVAFMLEFFVSLGVGHLYAGRTVFGILKLLVMLGPVILMILNCCFGIAFKSERGQSILGIFTIIGGCILCVGYFAWQLVDLVMFGINKYRDGNGVPLQHW